MSHYSGAEAVIKHPMCLIAALKEDGFDTVEYHEVPVPLVGYHGDKRAEVANVIIRRKHIGTASNDIGFLFKDGKCTAIVSDYDRHKYGAAWLKGIVQGSAVQAAIMVARASGETVTGCLKMPNGSVKIRILAR